MDTSKTIDPRDIAKTLLSIPGIVMEIIKGWFSINGDGQFDYLPDVLDTKLVVDYSYNINKDDIQNRPGIYVKRGNFNPQGYGRVGMDDLYSLGSPDGTQEYGKLPTCQIKVFVVSKIPGELELLGRKVYDALCKMSPIIRRDYDFKIFNVSSIGEYAPHKEYTEYYQIPIIIDTMFADIYPLKLESPVLQKIQIKIITGINNLKA